MSNKFKIESSTKTVGGTLAEIATAGLYDSPKEFTVRNTETGERFTATAYSEKGVGQKIAEGNIKPK